MGTVEPIYVERQKVVKEHDANDILAFIRGCVKKYRGKNTDSEIVGFINDMVDK